MENYRQLRKFMTRGTLDNDIENLDKIFMKYSPPLYFGTQRN